MRVSRSDQLCQKLDRLPGDPYHHCTWENTNSDIPASLHTLHVLLCKYILRRLTSHSASLYLSATVPGKTLRLQDISPSQILPKSCPTQNLLKNKRPDLEERLCRVSLPPRRMCQLPTPADNWTINYQQLVPPVDPRCMQIACPDTKTLSAAHLIHTLPQRSRRSTVQCSLIIAQLKHSDGSPVKKRARCRPKFRWKHLSLDTPPTHSQVWTNAFLKVAYILYIHGQIKKFILSIG